MTTTRRARSAARVASWTHVTSKLRPPSVASGYGRMRSTRQPVRSATPSAWQRATSASITVCARSLTGNSLPVSSRLSATPSDSNQRAAASASNAARTLRIGLRAPLKSSGETRSCVTLQRPPPEIRIFAPILRADSTTTMRGLVADPAPSSAAKIAVASPAAPAPTTTTSLSPGSSGLASCAGASGPCRVGASPLSGPSSAARASRRKPRGPP